VTAAPPITTERLLLRPLVESDVDELVALHEDADSRRFLGALDRDEAIRRVCDSEREWRERGHGRAAIVHRESGRFLGRSGLKHITHFDEVEIAWALHRDARGQGFATEAARAWIDWGFACLDAPYFTAMIEPQNERSFAVATRLGMTRLRDDVIVGRDIVVYAVQRSG
jgi:RimJ/RimL family protein N-acetyltransferase